MPQPAAISAIPFSTPASSSGSRLLPEAIDEPVPPEPGRLITPFPSPLAKKAGSGSYQPVGELDVGLVLGLAEVLAQKGVEDQLACEAEQVEGARPVLLHEGAQ